MSVKVFMVMHFCNWLVYRAFRHIVSSNHPFHGTDLNLEQWAEWMLRRNSNWDAIFAGWITGVFLMIVFLILINVFKEDPNETTRQLGDSPRVQLDETALKVNVSYT